MSLYVLWRVKFKRVITAFIPWYQIGLKDFDVEMSKCTLLSGRLTLNRCCIYVFWLVQLNRDLYCGNEVKASLPPTDPCVSFTDK